MLPRSSIYDELQRLKSVTENKRAMNQAETTEMDIVTEVQEARTLKHRSVAKCESLRSKSERNSLKKQNEKIYTVIYHPTVPSIFLFFNFAPKFIQSQFYCHFDQ